MAGPYLNGLTTWKQELWPLARLSPERRALAPPSHGYGVPPLHHRCTTHRPESRPRAICYPHKKFNFIIHPPTLLALT